MLHVLSSYLIKLAQSSNLLKCVQHETQQLPAKIFEALAEEGNGQRGENWTGFLLEWIQPAHTDSADTGAP